MARRGYPDTYRGEMAEAEAGQRECARSEWCYDRTVSTVNGETVITGALTPRAYCDMCTSHIRDCVLGLPGSWHLLGAGIGERPRTGQNSRSPFGPRLPLRENVDALMRLTAVILCGWEARIRVTARLTGRDALAPVHTIGAVKDAAGTIDRNLGVLLALQPGWMTRTVSLQRGPALGTTTSRWAARVGQPPIIADKATGELVEQLRDLAGAEIVRLGVDHVTLLTQAGGEDAGAEILRLHYRALAILGEVGQRADTLDGVPCKSCEDMALEMAEPPSDPRLPAMYSQCASCRGQMSREDFIAWSAMYAKWADDLRLTCRRCQAQNCGECAYGLCACPADVPHPRRRVSSAA
jgi:hypothetical protein